MSTQLLIEELAPSAAKLITESSNQGKDLILSGIMMQGGLKNRNGRIYPVKEIAAAVDNANSIIKENNGIFGELDHPAGLTVNLDRISHVITEMHMDGDNAIGRAKILSTPMGNIAKELINSGVRIGVSSRGAGTVAEGGGVTGFNLITVDLVATPSAPGAMPNAMYESLKLAENGNSIIDLAEAVRHDQDAQKYLKAEILKWISTGMFAKK